MFEIASTFGKEGSAQAAPRSLIRGELSMLPEFYRDMQDGPAGKTLQVRTTGKFYTPEVITTELIQQVLSVFPSRSGSGLRVVDPFCGDGRLVVQFIRKLSGDRKHINWELEIWD